MTKKENNILEEEDNILKSSSITCLLTFQVDVERGETGTENLFHIIPRCQYQILERHIDSVSLGEIEKKYNQEKGLDENTNIDIAGRTDFILDYVSAYLEDELGEEVCRASAELYFEAYFRSFRGELRNNVIKEIINRTEKAIRERLSVPRGRTPSELREDSEEEREKFIKDSLKYFKELEDKGIKINASRLAEKHYPDTNPLQSQRRAFKRHKLTFDELKRLYYEQKSS